MKGALQIHVIIIIIIIIIIIFEYNKYIYYFIYYVEVLVWELHMKLTTLHFVS